MTAQKQPAQDLDECAREPIAHLGLVQPHGGLLVLDEVGIIRAANVTARQWLDRTGSDVRGRPAAGLLAPALLERLEPSLLENCQARSALTWERSDETPGTIAVSGYRSGAHRIVELQPGPGTDRDDGAGLATVGEFTAKAGEASTTQELGQIIADTIRAITGFDRVKIYHFTPEFEGQVIAEAKAPKMESLLGFFFPESDIPSQARALYLEHRLRLITDVAGGPTELEATPDLDPRTIDLGPAALRSVSPTHIRYLQHMGVGSAMSVTLRSGDGLWGLIACHHRTRRYLSMPTRVHCDIIGRIASVQLQALDGEGSLRSRSRHRELAVRHATRIMQSESPREVTLAQAYQPIQACGVALVQRDDIITAGTTPPVQRIREFLPTATSASILQIETVDRQDAHPLLAGTIAGLLMVPAPISSLLVLIWFRAELIEEITWAGNPDDKPVVMADGQPTPGPRTSFQAWRAQRRGRSRPWQVSEIEYATAVTWAFAQSASLERAELAADLAQERATALQRANRDVERVSYALAHDLKTPVRGMNIGLKLLQDRLRQRSLDEETADVMQMLLERATRLSKMLRGVLDYAKSGQSTAPREPLDIEGIVRETLESAGFADRVNLTLDLPQTQPRFPVGTMDRVIQNLIENAVRHHDGDAIALHVRGMFDQGRMLVEVGDDGPGIPEVFQTRAFDVFATGRNSQESEGTGLGLGIVQRTVESLGGVVRIISAPELRRGTVLQIDVPYVFSS